MGETPKGDELKTRIGEQAEETVEGAESKHDPRPLIVIAIVLAVVGAHHVWRELEHRDRLSSTNLRTTKIEKRIVEEEPEPEPEPEPEDPKEDEPKAEEQPEPGLSEDDIESIVSERLAYQGESLRVGKEAITVGIRDGRVQVRHDLASEANVDYRVLAKRAGQRANALAAELTGKRVGDDESNDFSELTWVVRSPSGIVYVATCEGPGDQRVSDKAYGVLASSKGYVLASKVLSVLGSDSGLSAAAGEHPKDLDGAEIVVDGTTENQSEQVNKSSDAQPQ